jgi:16S rRNA G966 N2-methylase RsmD
MQNPELLWTTGKIQINYQPHLDAGGKVHAPILSKYIKERFGIISENALEVFSGLGFIGFHLISEGIARKMTFTDINPIAIKSINNNLSLNNLSQQCSAYCGDNLEALPKDSKFDLVIGNPPWSFKDQGDSFGLESDPDWRTHWNFYKRITQYLKPSGIVILLEWKPDEVEPSGSGIKSWDVRPRPPQLDFLEMIEAGGLQHIETVPLVGGWVGLHAVVSSKK